MEPPISVQNEGLPVKKGAEGKCEQSFSTTLDLGGQLFAWMGTAWWLWVPAPLPLRFASSGWRIVTCSWKQTDPASACFKFGDAADMPVAADIPVG